MDSVKPFHPVSEKGQQFLNSLDGRKKALHELAMKHLGSSYFVEKTNDYVKASKKST